MRTFRGHDGEEEKVDMVRGVGNYLLGGRVWLVLPPLTTSPNQKESCCIIRPTPGCSTFDFSQKLRIIGLFV